VTEKVTASRSKLFMKKYIKLSILITTLCIGCSKDFLDKKPLGELTFDTFFQNEKQAIEATNAVYNQLRSWECVGLGYIGCTDILSDDADKGSTANDQPFCQDMDDFGFDASNPYPAWVWKGYWRVISRANIAIENVPTVPNITPALSDRLVGESKFLRAYSYFLLVQWFGDLPVITKPLGGDEYYAQVRQPKSEVYAQIEKDLKDAIASLPEKSAYPNADLGRITKGAARGILAKLYMVQHNFGEAARLCEEIINSNEYSLLPKYSDNFLPVGENAAESIFEITAAALQTNVAGPGATPFNMIQGVRGVPNLGWGFNRPSDALVSGFEHPYDARREGTVIYVGETLPDDIATVQDNPDMIDERFNQKAWVPNHAGLQDNGPGNIRIMRYADVLLLAAEALNENNQSSQALIYLNKVRERARKSSIIQAILPDVTITEQSLLREKIYKERRSELGMEQQRWFDLVRWGRAADVMIAVGKTNFMAGKHELLPIPQSEIDLTEGKMGQNLGY
jgi:starch-binding outer membrane protein, SusD/RagB family